jgi:hypothetical protein
MKESIFDKVLQSLQQAARHNSNVMVKPEVILWPDPDRQWTPVIQQLQEKLGSLMVFGSYEPNKNQGPAIWLKCMVAKALPEATWQENETPIIYLPGISKQGFKNITAADLLLQPLMEYQYTGTMWLHENGKEWTVAAFIQNAQSGLGLKMSQDNATKEALLTALPTIFQEEQLFINKTFIDAEDILTLVYPDIIPNILKWMSEGDAFLNNLSFEKRDSFAKLCKTSYEFEPDYHNIKEIACKLGCRKNSWAQVWQYYANAPVKFKKIPGLLRLAMPDDLGTGMFALHEDSWPQVNEKKEDLLRNALLNISKATISSWPQLITQLQKENQKRKNTVWYDLGYAPLVDCIDHLEKMNSSCKQVYPSTKLSELVAFYTSEGYKADQEMREALASVVCEKDIEAVIAAISCIYKPWLENITMKFQKLLEKESKEIIDQKAEEESEEFILFVDALRFELAVDFTNKLITSGFEVDIKSSWTALPTLTPTAKPFNSPIRDLISKASDCNEFRPQLNNGTDLQTATFRDSLQKKDFHYVATTSEINTSEKTWMEIGDIDTRGHQEQSGMVRRVDELFNGFLETIETAFSKGVKRIKVVTDHGWLLLPGGLPKTELSKHLTETRWGRCALIKDGASTDLFHLPWQWNPSIFVAYAPGISFFKNNVAFAHGGLSLQECVVPTMLIQNNKKDTFGGKIQTFKWNNLICRIELEDAGEGYMVDIRTKPTDEKTSVVVSNKEKKHVQQNKCSLSVDDSFEGVAVCIVLINSTGIIIDKLMAFVGQ